MGVLRLFLGDPKLKVNLPALVSPPAPPAVREERAGALSRYTPPGEILPPEQYRPPQRYQPPARYETPPSPPMVQGWSLFSRGPKHPIKVSTREEDQGNGTRRIYAVFKNKSRFYYAGGKFMFRVKEGRKVVRQSCHGAYQIGTFSNAYTEPSYTTIGCLNPANTRKSCCQGFSMLENSRMSKSICSLTDRRNRSCLIQPTCLPNITPAQNRSSSALMKLQRFASN